MRVPKKLSHHSIFSSFACWDRFFNPWRMSPRQQRLCFSSFRTRTFQDRHWKGPRNGCVNRKLIAKLRTFPCLISPSPSPSPPSLSLTTPSLFLIINCFVILAHNLLFSLSSSVQFFLIFDMHMQHRLSPNDILAFSVEYLCAP